MKISAISLSGARSIVSRWLPGRTDHARVMPIGGDVLPQSAAAQVLTSRRASLAHGVGLTDPPAAMQHKFSMPPRQPVPVRAHGGLHNPVPVFGRMPPTGAAAATALPGQARLAAQIGKRWETQQRLLGDSWIGSLGRRTDAELQSRAEALHTAVASQSRALNIAARSGTAVPAAGQLRRQMDGRLGEAQSIEQALRSRRGRPAPVAGSAPRRTVSMPVLNRPLGAEVWNSAAIARVPPPPGPLASLPTPALQQRHDALVLARNAHEMSLRWFQRGTGSQPFAHEILQREMNGYAREIGQIDAILARRAGG
jgi:hypothetical protein